MELTAKPTIRRQQQAAAEARPDEQRESTAASSILSLTSDKKKDAERKQKQRSIGHTVPGGVVAASDATMARPGDAIEAYWPDDDTWLAATLVADKGNGIMSVAWEDGSGSDVPADYVRLSAPAAEAEPETVAKVQGVEGSARPRNETDIDALFIAAEAADARDEANLAVAGQKSPCATSSQRRNAKKQLKNALKKKFTSIKDRFMKDEQYRISKCAEGYTRSTIGDLDTIAHLPAEVSKKKGAELAASIVKKKEAKWRQKQRKSATSAPTSRETSVQQPWSSVNWDLSYTMAPAWMKESWTWDDSSSGQGKGWTQKSEHGKGKDKGKDAWTWTKEGKGGARGSSKGKGKGKGKGKY